MSTRRPPVDQAQDTVTVLDHRRQALWVRFGRSGAWIVVVSMVVALLSAMVGADSIRIGLGVEGIRPIQISTILGFGVLGAALVLTERRDRLATWAAAGVGAFAGSVLVMYAAGLARGAARILRFGVPSPDPYHGLPASNTAFILLALALGVVLLPGRRLAGVGLFAAVIGTGLAAAVLIGYGYGDRYLASFPLSQSEMSVPAALTGTVLGISILMLRERFRPSPLSSAGPGGTLMRRFAPLALAVPASLFALLEAQARFDLPVLLATVAISMTILLVGAFALTAARIDRGHVGMMEAAIRERRARTAMTQRAPIVGRLGDSLRFVGLDRLGSMEVATAFRPAEGYAAGDSYGVMEIGDHAMGFVLVDATGHGAEPALSALRVRDGLLQAMICGLDPGEALENVAWLLEGSDNMATAICAVLDSCSGRCVIASAGHPPPVLVTRGGVRLVEVSGPILASMVAGTWEPREVTLDPGDRLVFYTDGVADVYPVDGSESGHERLVTHLSDFDGSVSEMAESCLDVADEAPSDDEAVIVFGLDPVPSEPTTREATVR